MQRIKKIKNYNGYYITIYGQILISKPIKNQYGVTDKWKRRWKKQRIQNSGYNIVDLTSDKKQSTKTVHRLVAEHFIKKEKNKTDVNHKDGNKQNNNINNLEWVSKSFNTKHAWSNGLIKITDKMRKQSKINGLKKPSKETRIKMGNSKRKIDISLAQNIKDDHEYNVMTLDQLSIKYKISRGVIQKCIENKYLSINLKNNYSQDIIDERKRLKREQSFLKKAINKFGSIYDYSKINFTTSNEIITIGCKKHNLFFNQKASAHIFGKQSCKKCICEAKARRL